jgi:hypothetical protein
VARTGSIRMIARASRDALVPMDESGTDKCVGWIKTSRLTLPTM